MAPWSEAEKSISLRVHMARLSETSYLSKIIFEAAWMRRTRQTETAQPAQPDHMTEIGPITEIARLDYTLSCKLDDHL
jgi:hypothetical protein